MFEQVHVPLDNPWSTERGDSHLSIRYCFPSVSKHWCRGLTNLSVEEPGLRMGIFGGGLGRTRVRHGLYIARCVNALETKHKTKTVRSGGVERVGQCSCSKRRRSWCIIDQHTAATRTHRTVIEIVTSRHMSMDCVLYTLYTAFCISAVYV